MGFSATSGVLFFGAEGTKPVAWDAVPELIMDDDEFIEEQSKIFATMQNSQTVTINCSINKKGVENLMGLIKGFKLSKGPTRNRMIRRARKMQTNYICTYTFRKEGDKYVDERGAFRLVLQ